MILIGKGSKIHNLNLKMVSRHGLITGATGSGKTVTLQILAENLSSLGIPVIAVDIKGDLSGIATQSQLVDHLKERANLVGLTPYEPKAFPAIFWDVLGKQGHPIRATVEDLGPLLLSRLMGLSDAQEGALNIAFKIASTENLDLLNLKDLRSLLQDLGKRGKEVTTEHGNVAPATIGAIQRQLLVLEEQGGNNFFGEPIVDLGDFMRITPDGRGYVSIIAADKLISSPRLYAIFLFWLLAKLFKELPEVGDVDKPKLVFFFDEAHFLFSEANSSFLQQIENTVKLIRSKGIGIFFVTQNPLDIPDKVLSQLGNRIQHALRAYTPRDQKAVRAAATTFRKNPKINTEATITELAKGEALISFLDDKAVPAKVERIFIRPPLSQLGPLNSKQREAIRTISPVANKYEPYVDRYSAFEKISASSKLRAKNSNRDSGSNNHPAKVTDLEKSDPTDFAIFDILKTIGRQLQSSMIKIIARGLKL